MKQKLLKTMLLLSALVVGNSNVWADKETVTPTTSPSDGFSGAVNFTYETDKGSGTTSPLYNSSPYVKLYVNNTLTITPQNGETITGVSISATWNQGGSGSNKAYPTGISSSPSATLGDATPGTGSHTITWSGSTTGAVVFTISGSKGNLQVTSITVTYTPGGSGTTTSDLALTGAPVALSFDLYNDASPKTVRYTTSSTGAVNVSGGTGYVTTSVNTSTKTITITPVAVTPSAQTITVTQYADATYAAGEKTFTVTITDSTPAETFEKITSADDLAAGDELIFVYETGEKAAGTIGSNTYLANVNVDIDDSGSNNEIEVENGDGVNVFVLGGKSGAWTLYSKMDNGYLGESSTNLSVAATGSTWTISFSSGDAVVKATNKLQYNSSSPRFKTYSSSQTAIQLYRKVVDRTHVTVVGANGYATYVTKGKVAFPAEVKAYIATGAAGSVTIQEVGSAPANTAVIIEAVAGEYTLTAEASPANCSANILKASDGYIKGDGSTIYALGLGKEDPYDGQVGFYFVKSGVKVPAGKAYLEIAAAVKEFMPFDFGGDADGIQTLSDSSLKGENIYNLAGQRLQKMQKGINIVNGKKVLF